MYKLPNLSFTLPVVVLLTLAFSIASLGQTPCRKDGTSGFRTLAFGDSVMWGEGLRADDKFVNIVGEWLKERCGAADLPDLKAHAGATIVRPGGNNDILIGVNDEPSLHEHAKDAETVIDDSFDMPNIGEVNISYPTIGKQVETALADPNLDKSKVDLVLIDEFLHKRRKF